MSDRTLTDDTPPIFWREPDVVDKIRRVSALVFETAQEGGKVYIRAAIRPSDPRFYDQGELVIEYRERTPQDDDDTIQDPTEPPAEDG